MVRVCYHAQYESKQPVPRQLVITDPMRLLVVQVMGDGFLFDQVREHRLHVADIDELVLASRSMESAMQHLRRFDAAGLRFDSIAPLVAFVAVVEGCKLGNYEVPPERMRAIQVTDADRHRLVDLMTAPGCRILHEDEEFRITTNDIDALFASAKVCLFVLQFFATL